MKVGQDESTTSSMIALGSNGKFKVTIRPAGKSHVFVRGGKFVTGLLIDTLRFVLECLDDVYKFIPRLIYQYWKDTSFPQKSEKEPETFSALDLGRVGPCAFPCWVEPGNGDIKSKLDLTAFLSDSDEDAAFNGFQ